MVNNDINSGITSTSSSILTTTPIPGPNHPVDNDNGRTTQDTIAAVTVAILSVIVLITILLLIRAIKKRRQARQGRELNPVATISTGIMGTGIAAYSNQAMTWEPVNPNQEMSAIPSTSHLRS